MKKIVSLIIASIFILSLVGCDDFIESESSSEDVTVSTETEASEPVTDSSASSVKLSFSTVDIDGNSVTEEIMKDAKVVMINFWEPWCGPCVGEMPDLEKLYEEYKDEGFLVLGVFSSTDMIGEVREVLDNCGTTYPIVAVDNNLAKFMTDYVPTTIFVAGDGTVLSDEPMIGSNSYNSWKEVIESYLN